MVIQYDEEITLPDATAAYVKYTFDGQNVTQDVLSGAIRLESDGDSEAADPETPEDEADAGMNEEATDTEAENEADEAVEADPEPEVADNETDPEADQRAYASVNTGWVTEEEKENFNPVYLAGDQLTVAELVLKEWKEAGILEEYRTAFLKMLVMGVRNIRKYAPHAVQKEVTRKVADMLCQENLYRPGEDDSSLSRREGKLLKTWMGGKSGLDFSYYWKKIRKAGARLLRR